MKQKILIVSLAYIPFVGGAELAVKDITDRLPNYDFDLITYRFDRRWQKEERIGNVRVFRVCIGRFGDAYYGRTFEKFLFIFFASLKGFFLHRQNRYSIFWSLMASRASAPVLFLKFCFPRVPFFLTIQEGDTPEYAHVRAGIFLPLWRMVFRYADKVQVISSYLKDFCIHEGAPSHRIEIIPNGVDLSIFSREIFDNDSREFRQKLGIRDRVPVIVSASRLVPKNGIDILLRAVQRLKNEGEEFAVLLLGFGPEKERLEKYALENGLSVIFAGNVEQNEVPRYFAVSDVFVRPSRSEGLGSAFLEAMAAGLPIIATPVGGIPDFLTDRKTGLFVKPEDDGDLAKKIKELFNNNVLRQALADEGKKMAEEKYSWDIIAREFDKIFLELPHAKKILLTTGIFPPDIGGSATYSSILARELPERGYRLSVVTYGDGGARNEPHTYGGADIVKVSRKYPKGVRHAVFFLQCVWRARFNDAVLSADASFGGGLPAFLAARCAGKKFIVRITGEYSWEQGSTRFGITDSLDDFQKKTYGTRIEIMRKIEHWFVRRADAVIAPSEYLKKIVIGWGIFDKNIRVIYNAIPARQCLESNIMSVEESREELKISQKIPVFLSIARLVPWKGIPSVMNAIDMLRRKFPDAVLYIIGDGPEKDNFQKLIIARHFERFVFLMGGLDQNTVRTYMSAADVLVLNSSYEGFSHQLIEALVHKIPVAASNVGGNPEIIRNGHNGILFAYNNEKEIVEACIELYANTSLRKKFVENGIIDALSFTEDTMITELIKFLL
mgnify:FL=1